ncbi:acyl-CoA dehydrogenase [Actinomadura craniellae]|uniref:Acyl-CoA dehydrogenase n=1 Tax=Actinomadura craniellae TaxID=2231787 RepID=A0A365H3A0_9ACTN|nr:acyl-CoA dehydrogenase family protein [Actinomadura craniellae]RAY13472.1 acyl-CoA dehydrogenase [Actinomadura craniellae]
MDFDLDETQTDLRELAAGLLTREATTARLEAHEKSNAPYDQAAWKALAQAGLLGVCLPEEAGGAGLGAVELAVILREIGVRAAPLPAYPALALAAAPIARHGTPAQRALLGPLAEGEAIMTGAFRAPGAGDPVAAARPDGDGHVLDGVLTFVPYAAESALVLVPARVAGAGVGVFLVEPSTLDLTPHLAATGEPMYRIGLAGVRAGPDALLGGTADGAAWRTLRRHAVAGAVATASGVIAGALDLTTEYVKTREQFGRALAQFQAVTMQISDAYIARRALDVAMWAGVWRLAVSAEDDVDEVLAIAGYNACDPVIRALYTCQHLHGGIGLDVTYPLHRYFAWAKHLGHLLGGAQAQLDAVGDLLAGAPAPQEG